MNLPSNGFRLPKSFEKFLILNDFFPNFCGNSALNGVRVPQGFRNREVGAAELREDSGNSAVGTAEFKIRGRNFVLYSLFFDVLLLILM